MGHDDDKPTQPNDAEDEPTESGVIKANTSTSTDDASAEDTSPPAGSELETVSLEDTSYLKDLLRTITEAGDSDLLDFVQRPVRPRINGWYFPELEGPDLSFELIDGERAFWRSLRSKSIAEIWGVDLDQPATHPGEIRATESAPLPSIRRRQRRKAGQ